jgi:hypothetical protein
MDTTLTYRSWKTVGFGYALCLGFAFMRGLPTYAVDTGRAHARRQGFLRESSRLKGGRPFSPDGSMMAYAVPLKKQAKKG